MINKRNFKRVVLIVLDGVGVGALPDAAAFGDTDAATLSHVAAMVGGLELPNLQRLGLGNICDIAGVPPRKNPEAAWGKMGSRSASKDSVSGHWEISGLVKETPFATFPDGFSSEIIAKFTLLAGTEPLGNLALSGTDILRQLGEEHLRSKRPIVYTSSDSIFQIAAHEDVIPCEELYRLCRKTLEMLKPYGVCRVIARPFVGESGETFKRTARRHDFPVEPVGRTILDLLQEEGVPTCGIGKIQDLFGGRGLDRSLPALNNSDGLETLIDTLAVQAEGLLFVNLVDFDMLYGHRLDSRGFAMAMAEFDQQLPFILDRLTSDDLLLITADHGCDPTTAGTDHSREYVPLLAWTKDAKFGAALGVRESLSDIAATLSANFDLGPLGGESFLDELLGDEPVLNDCRNLDSRRSILTSRR